MKVETVNIAKKLSLFQDHWSPKIVAELNGQHVKLAKLKGDFVMHKHDHEDEMFLVLKGQLVMELENDVLEINEGEFVVIPKGTFHKPIAHKEVSVLLFEPATTLNTGNVNNNLTVDKLDRI